MGPVLNGTWCVKGRDRDLGEPDALDLRPLQHHLRGRSSRGDAVHKRLCQRADDAEHRDADPPSGRRRYCGVKSESRVVFVGERSRLVRCNHAEEMAGSTGLEPATSGLTVQCANQAAPRARIIFSRAWRTRPDHTTARASEDLPASLWQFLFPQGYRPLR